MSVHIRFFDNNCTTPYGMLSWLLCFCLFFFFGFLSYDDVAFFQNPNLETKSPRLSL